jgi:hypothetical protein
MGVFAAKSVLEVLERGKNNMKTPDAVFGGKERKK